MILKTELKTMCLFGAMFPACLMGLYCTFATIVTVCGK